MKAENLDKIMKTLSIIVPVYNEEKTVLKILKSIQANKINDINFEVIVINDGSTDATLSILDSNKDLFNNLIDLKINGGKGYAIKKGLSVATGDFVIWKPRFSLHALVHAQPLFGLSALHGQEVPKGVGKSPVKYANVSCYW